MKKIIPLSKDKFAVVDEEDFEFLNQWKWSADDSSNTTYAVRKQAGKIVRMHRVLVNASIGTTVDHIDGNGLNNSRVNLRVCTTGENCRNHKTYKSNTTGFKGVSAKGKSFVADICFKRKHIYLGIFKTAEEAAKAYDIASLKYFGEFASLNFPNVNQSAVNT